MRYLKVNYKKKKNAEQKPELLDVKISMLHKQTGKFFCSLSVLSPKAVSKTSVYIHWGFQAE